MHPLYCYIKSWHLFNGLVVILILALIVTLSILFRPFGFHVPKYFKNIKNFQLFGIERNWLRLFQKRAVSTKFASMFFFLNLFVIFIATQYQIDNKR